MLIVIEGVDGAGKSTLVEMLNDRMPENTIIKHRGKLKGDALREYEWDLVNYQPGGDNIVCDRRHLGELIYPAARGCSSKLTPQMRQHVDMFLLSRGATRIILDADIDLVQKRCRERGEDFVEPWQIALIHGWYRDYAIAHSDWWHLHSEDVSPNMVRDILGYAKLMDDGAVILQRWKTYVGGRWPDFLFVGDKRNGNDAAHGRPAYPSAFVPYRDTSGDFLIGAIQDAELGNTTYGIVNGTDEQDQLLQLWYTLGEPRAIALGDAAATAMNRSGVPMVGKVAHPQYMRRFHHKDRQTYGLKMKEMLDGDASLPL